MLCGSWERVIFCDVSSILSDSPGSGPVGQGSAECESIWIPLCGGSLLLVGSLEVFWCTPKQLFGRHLFCCVPLWWSGLLLVLSGHFSWCPRSALQICPLVVGVFVPHIACHKQCRWWHTLCWSSCTIHFSLLGECVLLLCFLFFLICLCRGSNCMLLWRRKMKTLCCVFALACPLGLGS